MEKKKGVGRERQRERERERERECSSMLNSELKSSTVMDQQLEPKEWRRQCKERARTVMEGEV